MKSFCILNIYRLQAYLQKSWLPPHPCWWWPARSRRSRTWTCCWAECTVYSTVSVQTWTCCWAECTAHGPARLSRSRLRFPCWPERSLGEDHSVRNRHRRSSWNTSDLSYHYCLTYFGDKKSCWLTYFLTDVVHIQPLSLQTVYIIYMDSSTIFHH